jgi:ABC-2 type transport system permease protein
MEAFLFSHALRDFLRLKRILPWIGLGILSAVIGKAWHQVVPDATQAQQYGDVAAMLVFRMVALASAIFTTSIISQEVEQKTIVYLLTRPVPRWKLLLMRYLASVVVVAGIGILSACMLSGALFGPRFLQNDLLLNDMKAIVVGALGYGALFLFVSLLFNRAMIICVLFAFGWETSIPNLPGDLYHLSIFSYMTAIGQHPQTDAGPKGALLSGQLGNNLISPASAYPTMAVFTIVIVLAAVWWFTNFEYVPREDAE